MGVSAVFGMAACIPDEQVPAPAPIVEPVTEPAPIIEPAQDYPVYQLPACSTEDSTENCYWDAANMGNGQGQSFVVLNGTVYYAN
jgi:hypothetical protein